MDSLTWLLATRNQGKIRELRQLLAESPVRVIGLEDLGVSGESPETGETFLENAMQKAKFYFERAGVPALADDSGLEVDALNGAPGIHSARFGGLPTHAEKCRYLLDLLGETPQPYRSARFCCAAVYYDGRSFLSAHGSLEGFIGFEPIGDKGFGYDPIFHPSPDGPSAAQIELAEKNRISHRGKAFRALIALIRERGGLVCGGQPPGHPQAQPAGGEAKA